LASIAFNGGIRDSTNASTYGTYTAPTAPTAPSSVLNFFEPSLMLTIVHDIQQWDVGA